MNLRIRQLVRYLLSPETRPQSNNRGLVFLFAFLSACGLWTIVTLNEEYETSLRYTVRLPENVTLAPEEAPTIRIDARGSGIDLMMARLRSKKDTLSFDFTEEEILEGFLLLKRHEDNVKNSLKGVKIASLKPEKLYFDYQDEYTKLVPLVFGTDINLAPAFQLETLPSLSKDSILLRGPKEVIDTINTWRTTGRIEQEISELGSFDIAVLDTFESIDVFPKNVKLTVNPIKYTEIKLNIPIEITNLPLNLDVRLSHNTVDYTCLVPMDDYSRIEQLGKTMSIKIPFSELDENVPDIIPNAVLPPSLKLIQKSPMLVNFVLVYPPNFSP